MPELPEVEVAARCLRLWAVGERVLKFEADPKGKRLFRPGTAATWNSELAGLSLQEVRRIGKVLLLTFNKKGGPAKKPARLVGVLSHLGMTGKWVLRPTGEAVAYSRARFDLPGKKTLHYRDPRLFGRLLLVPGAAFDDLREVRGLGTDPLDHGIDGATLKKALSRTARPIKVVIMDQRLLPGIGNIQASEGCFRAKIDPRRPAKSLSLIEVKRLARSLIASIQQTLALETQGMEEGQDITYVEEGERDNPFKVYGKAGKRCPRCRKADIFRVVQSQRSTFYCPACQV